MTATLKRFLNQVLSAHHSGSSPVTDPLIGQTVGFDYQIDELLGQGAMAKVYRARQRTLDRVVAIKILTTEAPDMVARFVHEIRVHSKLKHTNIAEALDCVTDERTGHTYFVMEFLDGASLQLLMRNNASGLKSEEDIAYILGQIAGALNYAHNQGVIHRDLKPANMILVLRNDVPQVKVVDFGMARLHEQLQRFTKTGHIVGSPLYMSPEQCLGDELDSRSDVYTLALVAYELATGKAPFSNAPSLYDVMKSHCEPDIKPDPIASKSRHLRCVRLLDSIIYKAMDTDPNKRYQSAAEFGEAIRKWYDAVQKGLSDSDLEGAQKEVLVDTKDLGQPAVSSDASETANVAVPQSAASRPAPSAASQAGGNIQPQPLPEQAPPAIPPRHGEEKTPLVQPGQPRTAWKVPSLVVTNSDGGWSVSGQELNYFPQGEPLVGRVLNMRYQILDLLGEGGMSVVYRAEDRETSKFVAVKTLKFLEPELCERFTREIELHSQLKHPNIVRAIEGLEVANQAFFIMELLPGKVLEDYLNEEGQVTDFADICSILAQICDALEYAHDLGMIHRDLKPGNVMLVEQQGGLRVKVLDFGLAKIQADLQKLTRTGVLIGSPGYMSPEHCLGDPLTNQSDLYSLGVLAYEMMSGHLPYESDSEIETLRAHCNFKLKPTPISTLRPDLPATKQMDAFMDSLLEKDIFKRAKSIEELRPLLDAWWQAAGGSQDESPFKTKRRRRRKPEVEPTAAPQAPPAAQRSELDSIVTQHRTQEAEILRSRFRESSIDPHSMKMIGVFSATILVLCCLGYFVWQVAIHPPKPAQTAVIEEKPITKATPQPVETDPRVTEVGVDSAHLPADDRPTVDGATPAPAPARRIKIIAPGKYRGY